ncbi:MAG: polysaccharide biosynthesis tyrosine autokinase [Verrucomicrobiota bacterium]|nr:polysaccharide biosynthesis tyrosine autokinase [Limisphaera sp.]MDW8380519.1 polysaccharide biosynthesis tyrosine autokinase [Verrucomicrobiota bacterium]
MNEYPQPAPENRSVRSARFFTLLQRWRSVLRRHWWVLPVCALGAMALHLLVLWNSPPAYASRGRMIVNVRIQVQTGANYVEELSNFLGTQVALMQSDTVLNRAAERVHASRPDLVPTPVKVSVGITPKTTIFNLRAVGSDPAYVQAYLDAVMEEFINLKKEMRVRSSDVTLAGITEEVARLEKELKNYEEELLQFQATNSIVFLQEQGNLAGNYLAQLNQQLAMLQSELSLLNLLNLEQNLERQQAAGVITGVRPTPPGQQRSPVDVLRIDSDYLKVKQEIQLLKAEEQQLAEYLRPKHPKMIALREDIQRKEKLLEIVREQSAEQIESRKKSLQLQIENLQREIRDWEARALEASSKMAHYQKIRANIARLQSLYDRLLQTMQAVGVDKDIVPESVAIYERASVAEPDRLSLSLSLTLAGLVGLMLGVGLLLVVERFDDRMNTFVELQDHFEEPVLGQIPRERSGRNGELALLRPEDDRHAFAEAYRNVRSSLLFMPTENGHERPRLLLVTSSIPNDGKSLTVANLAITLALGGARVLLVDGDLRKGVLHRRFGVESAPGFSEVLLQKTPWRDVVRSTAVVNLALIPSGTPSQRSSELFLQPLARQVLQEMAAEYEYVVMDSAPVMAADDVTTLAPLMHGVIFVIRAQHTSARVARAALDLLYQRNVRILGLVFNAVNPKTGEYYYYSRYKDYYRHSTRSRA